MGFADVSCGGDGGSSGGSGGGGRRKRNPCQCGQGREHFNRSYKKCLKHKDNIAAASTFETDEAEVQVTVEDNIMIDPMADIESAVDQSGFYVEEQLEAEMEALNAEDEINGIDTNEELGGWVEEGGDGSE
jgi:hypothetical protein